MTAVNKKKLKYPKLFTMDQEYPPIIFGKKSIKDVNIAY